MNSILPHLKSLAWLWRHVTSIGVVIIGLWSFSGPFVESYAADALLKVLKEQGIDPTAIEEMKQQGIENGNEIGAVKTEIQELEAAITQMNTNDALQTQTLQSIDGLLKEVVRAQLNKRTGVVDPTVIPPFPGEAPPE
jgi:hypothetical protein